MLPRRVLSSVIRIWDYLKLSCCLEVTGEGLNPRFFSASARLLWLRINHTIYPFKFYWLHLSSCCGCPVRQFIDYHAPIHMYGKFNWVPCHLQEMHQEFRKKFPSCLESPSRFCNLDLKTFNPTNPVQTIHASLMLEHTYTTGVHHPLVPLKSILVKFDCLPAAVAQAATIAADGIIYDHYFPCRRPRDNWDLLPHAYN